MSIEKVGTNANSSVKPVSIPPHTTPVVVNSASVKGSEQEKDEGMSTGAKSAAAGAIGAAAAGIAGYLIFSDKKDA